MTRHLQTFWKEEEMLHHGKHAPFATILRPVAGIKFEMNSFYAYNFTISKFKHLLCYICSIVNKILTHMIWKSFSFFLFYSIFKNVTKFPEFRLYVTHVIHTYNDLNAFYMYAFIRCFYPKWLKVHSGYTFFHQYVMCVPWKLIPKPFALLTQCSTTEPQEYQSFTMRMIFLGRTESETSGWLLQRK